MLVGVKVWLVDYREKVIPLSDGKMKNAVKQRCRQQWLLWLVRIKWNI